METIWKYELKSIDEQKIYIPKGAELLTVQMQGDCLCLWAKVDSEQEKEDMVVSIRGTGTSIGEVGKYIGTYQLHGGSLVFHVFTQK